MTDVLQRVSSVAMLVFLLTSMLGVGLSLTLPQIVAPLRNARLVASAVAANFVLVPLIAIGIALLFRLDEPFASGLLLLALAPGAPFLPKLVEVAKGDMAFAVGLMVLLMVGSVVFLPVALPHLVPGVTVDVWPVARPLVLLMLLPIVAGLTVRARRDSFAARLRPGLKRLSDLCLLLVILLVVGLNLSSVLQVFGTGAIAAGILLIVLSSLAGHLLGGPRLPTRKVMVLGTGFRNLAAALVVAEQSLRNPRVTVMIVIAALLGLLLLVPLAVRWGRRAPAS